MNICDIFLCLIGYLLLRDIKIANQDCQPERKKLSMCSLLIALLAPGRSRLDHLSLSGAPSSFVPMECDVAVPRARGPRPAAARYTTDNVDPPAFGFRARPAGNAVGAPDDRDSPMVGVCVQQSPVATH